MAVAVAVARHLAFVAACCRMLVHAPHRHLRPQLLMSRLSRARHGDDAKPWHQLMSSHGLWRRGSSNLWGARMYATNTPASSMT